MKRKHNLYQFFLKRYGLGDSMVKWLCEYSGYHPYYKELKPGYLAEKIRNFQLSHPQYLDANWKKKVQKDIQNLIQSRSYKALRMLKKLPVRGQRTRTNHRTAKRTLWFLWK